VAILSPEGISRRLLDNPPGTPIEVQVALDREATFRVAHQGLQVTPASNALIVSPDAPEAEALSRAAVVAARAISSLPETPFTGAGINLRYKFELMPDALLQAVRSEADDRFADLDHQISGKLLRRTFVWVRTMTVTKAVLVANFVADLRKAQIAQLVREGYDVHELDAKDDTWVGAAWATAILQRIPRGIANGPRLA